MSAEEDVWENDEPNIGVSFGENHEKYLDMGEANDEISLEGDASLYEPIPWKTLFILLADAREIDSLITPSEN